MKKQAATIIGISSYGYGWLKTYFVIDIIISYFKELSHTLKPQLCNKIPFMYQTVTRKTLYE